MYSNNSYTVPRHWSIELFSRRVPIRWGSGNCLDARYSWIAWAKATLNGSSFPRARRLRRNLPCSAVTSSLGALRLPRGYSVTCSITPMSKCDMTIASSSAEKRSRPPSGLDGRPEPETCWDMAEGAELVGAVGIGGVARLADRPVGRVANPHHRRWRARVPKCEVTLG